MIKYCVIAIDQGTTSSRAIAFSDKCAVLCSSQKEFKQIYPHDGWVEHDPIEIWDSVVEVTQDVIKQVSELDYKVASIGITNQRETTVVWDKKTSKPIYNAIVWQDRRTASHCAHLRKQHSEASLQSKTGLLMDPYFSATKVAWIIDNVRGARVKAEAGELAFGTIDTWLIWQLTAGQSHATDATNASRTNLFNINTMQWDLELLQLFNVPQSLLPKVLNCSDHFGDTANGLFPYSISIGGVAGDQQAASIGQCCFNKGDIKSTYGTGCFVLMNTGADIVQSKNKLLTTVAYQLDRKTTYALEASIFVAGAAVQWLRDGIGVIESAKDTEAMASSLNSNEGLCVVPAFTGLGAPYWQPDVRGAIFGITRATSQTELVRATLESVCYLTADLFAAMAQDGIHPKNLKVDGGMVANNWLLQYLSNILDIKVTRPTVLETTAVGVAYLAGKQAGVYGDTKSFSTLWQKDREFSSNMDDKHRSALLDSWHKAVRLTCEYGAPHAR